MTGSGRCHGPGCLMAAGPHSDDYCSEQCERRWTAAENGILLGRQEPTYLWVPEYGTTAGLEVIELAKSAGLILDPWQQLLIMHAFAEDPAGAWLCFEIAIIVSRQNGKGSILEAVELAWLFLFGERLVIHSAHLFETSREHFLRISTLIQMNPDFDNRVKRMREGRGAEEIELKDGARLKFMTRKGGAGRGFTGDKTVMDEAMYLDAGMMAAGLPTMATRPNAQIWYTGSAGMKHSTQLGAVRRRAYTRSDPSLMYAEWTAETRTVDEETGAPIVPDDRAAPRTWAKTNPGYAFRISQSYIEKEARALGGTESVEFGTERLGVGDWPEGDQAWEAIAKRLWDDAWDATSTIAAGRRLAYGVDADPDRMIGTITVYGCRADGKGHIETVIRQRGIAWIPGWFTDVEHPHRAGAAVALLRNGAASSLIKALTDAELVVHCPTEIEYAHACADLHTSIMERDDIRHLGQPSLTTAAGGSRQLRGREGGWVWDRTVLSDQSPLVGATVAKWHHDTFKSSSGGWVSSSDELLAGAVAAPPVTGRGATGFASVRRPGRVSQ